MKVLTEKIEKGQAVLQLEVEDSELNTSLEEAYHHLRPRVSIPGFRKGKAPRNLIEQYLGKEALVEEALDHLIPKILKEAIQARSLEVVAEPEVKVTQMDPVKIEAVIPLRPTVKLGNYKEIRMQPELVEISDDDLEKALGQLREQQAVRTPVDRPVQYSDLLTMKLEGISEGKEVIPDKEVVYEVVKDSPLPVPGFADNLIGAQRSEDKAFSISFPADYTAKELAGKAFSFKANISEIKEKRLPELDDNFAKSLGKESLGLLRDNLKERLQTRAEEISRHQLERKIMDAVLKLCEVDYSPILVSREVDRLINEESRQFKEGIKGLEAYLKNVGRSMEKLREELRPVAERRIVDTVILDKIAEEEKPEVTAGEIDSEIEKMAKSAGNQEEQWRTVLTSPEARHTLEHSLLTQKTVDRLVQIAQGQV